MHYGVLVPLTTTQIKKTENQLKIILGINFNNNKSTFYRDPPFHEWMEPI